MNRVSYFMLLIMLVAVSGWAGPPLTLKAAIDKATGSHPQLASLKATVLSHEAEASASTAPPSPMLGVSELNRGNTTLYATVSQKVDFPTKYFLRQDKHDNLAQAQKQKWVQAQLRLRSQVVGVFYALHAVEHIIELNRRDLERLKEASRIAESRYASGKSPQHDSMKAHVAQTQAETRLIELGQERDVLEVRLQELLSDPAPITLPKKIPVPLLPPSVEANTFEKTAPPPAVKEKQKLRQAASSERALAAWAFAPDFQLRYQRRISGNPDNSHIVGVEMSIPLWFWGDSNRLSAARQAEQAAEKAVAHEQQSTLSELKILRAKLVSDHSLLKIFESSLEPQALTSYNSATGAYRAGKISFTDFLESERSLLDVEIARYRTLTRYVENLARFEAVLGKELVKW